MSVLTLDAIKRLPKLASAKRLRFQSVRSALYTLLIRKVTHTHYEHLFDVLPPGAHVLDVGIGNGLMLDRFGETIRARRIRIEGLDIEQRYLDECGRRISRHGLDDLVSCRNEDIVRWLETATEVPPFVYFSASFMLLPDPARVLELLSERLPPGGQVLFTQTLLEERNKLLEWVKPRLKFLTTVDFGRAQYRSDFLARMARLGFRLRGERRFDEVAGNKHIYFHAFERPAK